MTERHKTLFSSDTIVLTASIHWHWVIWVRFHIDVIVSGSISHLKRSVFWFLQHGRIIFWPRFYVSWNTGFAYKYQQNCGNVWESTMLTSSTFSCLLSRLSRCARLLVLFAALEVFECRVFYTKNCNNFVAAVLNFVADHTTVKHYQRIQTSFIN